MIVEGHAVGQLALTLHMPELYPERYSAIVAAKDDVHTLIVFLVYICTIYKNNNDHFRSEGYIRIDSVTF